MRFAAASAQADIIYEALICETEYGFIDLGKFGGGGPRLAIRLGDVICVNLDLRSADRARHT